MNLKLRTAIALLLLTACGNNRKTEVVSNETPGSAQLSDSIIALIEARSFDSCTFVQREIWNAFPFEEELETVLAVEYKDVAWEARLGELTVGEVLLTDRFSKIVELDEVQIQQIKEVFQGYENGRYSRSACYEPRHCLYFLDDTGRVLSYCEFCFACNQMRTSDRDYFHINCSKQLTTFKYLFQGLGMTKFEWYK